MSGMLRMSKVAVLVAVAMVVGILPLQLNAQPKVSFPLNPPTWYAGDTWTWTGPMGNMIAMTVQSAATDGSYTILGMGAGARSNMDWGFLFTREQVGNFLFLDWPLTYNKQWRDQGSKYTFVWRVGPVQSVKVSAGTFTAVELLCSVLTPAAGNPPVQQQAGTGFAWYAPAAKAIVKIHFGPEAAWPTGVRNKALTLTKYTLHSSFATAPAPEDSAVTKLSALHGQAFDVAYLQAVIPVDDESVEMALTATLYADHPDLLHWNQNFTERKHTEIQKMVGWLGDLGAQPTQRNVGVATAPVKKLRTLRGPALEQTYMALISEHLDRTVALSKLAAQKADRPELRAFAASAAAADAGDSVTLRGWLTTWYH